MTGELHILGGIDEAGLGPILARACLGQHPDRMRRAIAPSYILVALFYLGLSWAPEIVFRAGQTLVWAAVLVVLVARASRPVSELDGAAGRS